MALVLPVLLLSLALPPAPLRKMLPLALALPGSVSPSGLCSTRELQGVEVVETMPTFSSHCRGQSRIVDKMGTDTTPRHSIHALLSQNENRIAFSQKSNYTYLNL